MVAGRALDRRMMSLQRQGRMGTFAPMEGQEAVCVGSALAFRSGDWVFPSYREHATVLERGLPLKTLLEFYRGHGYTNWDIRRFRVGLYTIPISTHLPHAVGQAYYSALRGEDSVTGVFFGDGATSASDFHSGMNFAGVWNLPVVFICSNNQYAISLPVSSQTGSETISQKAVAYGFEGIRVDGMDPLAVHTTVANAVRKAHRGGGPTLIEGVTYRYGPHATADDPRRYRTPDEEQSWRAFDPLIRMRRHLKNIGLWDDLLEKQAKTELNAAMDEALEEIEARPLPRKDRTITQVYERIPLALASQLHRSQQARSLPTTNLSSRIWQIEESMSPEPEPSESWNMAQAINAALGEAMDRFPEAVILGEDVGRTGGVFRITEDLQIKYGDQRVIDTPLCETGIVGTAIGMAIAGARPIVEIQFDGFLYNCFEQIATHLSRMRYRTQGGVDLPMVVRFPNGGGINAHEFHNESPEALFCHLPGMVVVCPSTPTDAKGLLAAAIDSSDPVIFAEPKVLYRAGRESVPSRYYTIPIGRAATRRNGSDVTVVTYGGMVTVALEAADQLADQASVEVIDLRTLYPWDKETVLSSVTRTGRLVVVQEPPHTAGMAAEISATVAEEAIYDLAAPVVRVTGFDAPLPPFAIESYGVLDVPDVVAGIMRALAE
jgi:2-oxoisovalerate dehydrogenase E1 component